MKKDKTFGFTLAEVLITLGIIGVVAALTIPGLIINYKKVRTVTVLKETYSILQQAIRLSQEDNGDSDGWDISLNGSQFFHKYFANYLKWQKEYTTAEINSDAPHYYLDGESAGGFFYNPTKGAAHFVLINGSMVAVRKSNEVLIIVIDVNALDKPNTFGKDTFMFVFTPQYGLEPWGGKGSALSEGPEPFGTYNREKVIGSSSHLACNKLSQGKWCSALIIQDGWKISNDYPWK